MVGDLSPQQLHEVGDRGRLGRGSGAREEGGKGEGAGEAAGDVHRGACGTPIARGGADAGGGLYGSLQQHRGTSDAGEVECQG